MARTDSRGGLGVHSTCNAACIVGRKRQVYRYCPGFRATYFQLLAGPIDFESNLPSDASPDVAELAALTKIEQ